MPFTEYERSFTSFGGTDIVPVFNNKVIGECQALTYSVRREKAPVYTFGSANPRSFSRGKRGIAGSCVFTLFDRSALDQIIQSSNEDQRQGGRALRAIFSKNWKLRQIQGH